MLPFLLIPNASVPGVVGATRALLERAAATALADDPSAFRTESFHQYYNQGPWSPANGGDQCHLCSGSGTTRALDDASNTYIGLNVHDPSLSRRAERAPPP